MIAPPQTSRRHVLDDFYHHNMTGSTQLVQHGSSGAQILPPFNMSDDTTKPTRDDSAVLLKLFSQCSGHSVPDSPIAHLTWFKWTGWGTNYSMKHWYGVYTRCEDGDATGTERVTRLVLPKNGLRGKKAGNMVQVVGVLLCPDGVILFFCCLGSTIARSS